MTLQIWETCTGLHVTKVNELPPVLPPICNYVLRYLSINFDDHNTARLFIERFNDEILLVDNKLQKQLLNRLMHSFGMVNEEGFSIGLS